MNCCLCNSRLEDQQFNNDKQSTKYRICWNCDLIQQKKGLFLSEKAEKERYMLHENSENNKGYLQYLNNILENSIRPFLKQGNMILDFGCGPEKTWAKLLREDGYKVSTYDPYFDNRKGWINERFDAVTAIEVFEHLSSPAVELNSLERCLKTGNFLIIRTMLHKSDWEIFRDWWYKDDPTHISFYSKTTIDYICKTWGYKLIQIIDNCEIVLRKK